ncbi:MAG TPA: DUF4169 family protein [Enterovirga sp.]|jgi:hypothetical protein|nr:DUF4169 family protein [Enterovirga sp.]
MAEIVNLRRARKAKAKTDAETQAAQNRIRFGQTKAERERVAADDALAARRLEGHWRGALRDEDPLDKP